MDGSKIPLVNWDVGPSWAGLLPISNDPNETRKVRRWGSASVSSNDVLYSFSSGFSRLVQPVVWMI